MISIIWYLVIYLLELTILCSTRIYIYIYKLFFRYPETPWNGTPKLTGIKIFHSIGQTEMGSETVFITLIWTMIDWSSEALTLLIFCLFFYFLNLALSYDSYPLVGVCWCWCWSVGEILSFNVMLLWFVIVKFSDWQLVHDPNN